MCAHGGCRTNAPIAELTAEHVAILARAEPLSEATRHHRTIDRAIRDRLLELLDIHVAKEETDLYPILVRAFQPPGRMSRSSNRSSP